MTEGRKTALVTGAGSGTGRAAAVALSEAGWQVALMGRTEGTLRETAEQGDHERFLVLPADVSDPEAVATAFDQIERAWGRLDLLFNNAGSSAPAMPIDDVPIDMWMRMVSVNLTGTFLCARAAFHMMRHQSPQGGRIINNGSVSAHVPRPGSAPYSATKHAVTGLTKTIALDGRPFNISCGQIDIGNAATPLTERMTRGMLQPDGSMMPEPRMDVKHVADTIVLMANLPPEANIPFVTVMATNMPYLGRG